VSAGSPDWGGSGSESKSARAIPAAAAARFCPVDELAEALIDENGNPRADVAVLYGYLWRRRAGSGATPKQLETAAKPPVGRQATEKGPEFPIGETRLYLTWLMDEYVDLTDVTILYWRKVPYDGGTLVWVPRDQELHHVYNSGRQEKSYEVFMAGQISADHLAGAPVAGAGAGLTPSTADCGRTISCADLSGRTISCAGLSGRTISC
jgi:hypothetical protein